jgi:hypothetical protein
MRSPSSEIVTAIDTDTTSFCLSLDLVLAKQIESAILANRHTASMCIDEVPISVCPSASRNDILGLHDCSKQEVRERVLTKHDGRTASEWFDNWNILQVALYKLSRMGPGIDCPECNTRRMHESIPRIAGYVFGDGSGRDNSSADDGAKGDVHEPRQ